MSTLLTILILNNVCLRISQDFFQNTQTKLIKGKRFKSIFSQLGLFYRVIIKLKDPFYRLKKFKFFFEV